MPTAKPNRHAIYLGETKVAMDLTHHVNNDFVGRIVAMHRATHFCCGKWANIPSVVVHFPVVLLKPMFKFKSEQPRFHFICHTIGDRADAEELIACTTWWSFLRQRES